MEQSKATSTSQGQMNTKGTPPSHGLRGKARTSLSAGCGRGLASFTQTDGYGGPTSFKRTTQGRDKPPS